MTGSGHSIHEPEHDDIEFLLNISARTILAHEDPKRFLSWFEDSAPHLAPAMFAPAPDEVTRRGLARLMGRAIWNATPLPGNRFRPRPRCPNPSATSRAPAARA